MLAALSMEHEFGDVMNADVGSILSAAPSTWSNVKIKHVLDLATGHYRFVRHGLDDSTFGLRFLTEDTHANKLDVAFQYRRRTNPGKTWVYHHSDPYIMGSALQQHLQSVTGDGDLIAYLNKRIFGPLGVSKLAQKSIRTTYDSFKQPYTTEGMFFTVDDALKIARFINPSSSNRGRIEDRQVLDAYFLDAALQLDPGRRGKTAYDGYMYNKGMWAVKFPLACDKFNYIPFAKGEGPSLVAHLPNGSTFVSFSDSSPVDDPSWFDVALEASKIRC